MESFIRRIEILMIAREQRDNLHLPRQKLFRSPQQREKNQPPLCIIRTSKSTSSVCMQIDCIIIEDTSSVTPDLLFATMEHGPTANTYCIAPEYLSKIRNVLFHPFSGDPARTQMTRSTLCLQSQMVRLQISILSQWSPGFD